LLLRVAASRCGREAEELDARVETGIFRETDTLEFSSVLREE
jgi:hypothetical protein